MTPADALRAISENVNCRNMSVAKWLHRQGARGAGAEPEFRCVYLAGG